MDDDKKEVSEVCRECLPRPPQTWMPSSPSTIAGSSLRFAKPRLKSSGLDPRASAAAFIDGALGTAIAIMALIIGVITFNPLIAALV
jgi:hypothetical protein